MVTSNSEHGPWQTLTASPAEGLIDARRQIHWAAQVASSVGKTLIEKAPDDSHSAFSWLSGHQCMASGIVHGSQPFRSALRPADLHLLILSDHDVEQLELPLSGRTLEQAYHWLDDDVERQLGRPLPAPLARPAEIEAHPVGEGARFSIRDRSAFNEIAKYFGNAHLLLEGHAAGRSGASPIRIWPHHLDVAVLITVEAHDDPEKARTVGVGMTPGDGSYSLPYLYVNCWPQPSSTDDLPDLPGGGHWHTDGWFGAVLPADKWAAGGDGDEQKARAGAFLDAAIDACQALVSS